MEVRNSAMMKMFRTVSGLVLSVLLFAAQVHGQETSQVVLFDQGHGQRFLVENNGPLDLSGLGELFRERGFTVKAGHEKISAQLLIGVDVLVISGPFVPFSDSEIGHLKSFVQRGGSLSVMLHVGPMFVPLLKEFGVSVLPGVIHESENMIAGQAVDFSCVDLASHPLTSEVDSFKVYGSWGLASMDEQLPVIGRTSTGAWMDVNRNQQLDKSDTVQSFGLVVAGNFGLGRVMVSGDDAIFQNRFLTGSNRILGRNLVDWLGQQGVVDVARIGR